MATEDDALHALEAMTRPAESENEASVPSGQRPCPICGEIMQVESIRGIQVDFCAAHGVWLDNGELRSLMGQPTFDSNRLRSEAIRQAHRDGKISGMLLGAWALLLPD